MNGVSTSTATRFVPWLTSGFVVETTGGNRAVVIDVPFTGLVRISTTGRVRDMREVPYESLTLVFPLEKDIPDLILAQIKSGTPYDRGLDDHDTRLRSNLAILTDYALNFNEPGNPFEDCYGLIRNLYDHVKQHA